MVAAVRDEVAAVRSAERGEHNDTLHGAALRLGKLLAGVLRWPAASRIDMDRDCIDAEILRVIGYGLRGYDSVTLGGHSPSGAWTICPSTSGGDARPALWLLRAGGGNTVYPLALWAAPSAHVELVNALDTAGGRVVAQEVSEVPRGARFVGGLAGRRRGGRGRCRCVA